MVFMVLAPWVDVRGFTVSPDVEVDDVGERDGPGGTVRDAPLSDVAAFEDDFAVVCGDGVEVCVEGCSQSLVCRLMGCSVTGFNKLAMKAASSTETQMAGVGGASLMVIAGLSSRYRWRQLRCRARCDLE